MFAKEHGMEYIETSAKTGSNVAEAFGKITESIYRKVESGAIDVTLDSSGVRLGTEVKMEQLKDSKLSLNKPKKQQGGSCC